MERDVLIYPTTNSVKTFNPIVILVVAEMIPMGTIQIMGMRQQTIMAHHVKCVLQTKITTKENASIIANIAAYHQSGASRYFFISLMWMSSSWFLASLNWRAIVLLSYLVGT